MISVLFVCQGNICRSPTLQGCLQSIVDQHKKTHHYYIDSCGTLSSFCGQKVDPRACAIAKTQDIILSHTSRVFHLEDFLIFDYIFTVSASLKRLLLSLTSEQEVQKKVYLATHFSSYYKDQDMKDPYEQSEKGFEEMMKVAYESAQGIFNYLEGRY